MVIFRNATSPLLGFAEHGTPLCPSTLLITIPKLKRCTIIATGTDHVSTRTGTRPVHGKFDVVVNVDGGGAAGQAGAVRHGIARALLEFNAELRKKLKRAGFLTRDPRAKERKKYGQKGARKRFQFSKR